MFRVPDLRKRLLFTLALLAVYRLGGHIPTPGINIQRWEEFFRIAGRARSSASSICSRAATSAG